MPSFPLIPPASPSASDLKLTPNNIVGENESPFTYSQQIFEYPGDRWEAELALPAMSRAQAEPWLAFLSALRGKAGTFLLGDPNGVPQGSAARSNVNLLQWSESLDNTSAWTSNGIGVAGPTVAADSVADPNGFITAETLTFPTTGVGQESFLEQNLGFVPVVGQSYTLSCWFKHGVGSSINLRLVQSTGENDVAVSCSITTAWQRFQMTITPGSVGTGVLLARIHLGGSQAARGLWAWGAQLEKAASVSGYIGTSFGFNNRPQISMNGTTQGPKFILLKGLAPNSVAFKAGDYIECGYGLAATRITTSGGSGTTKLFYGPSVSTSGQVYVFSGRVRNVGAKTVVIGTNLGGAQNVLPGTEAQIAMSNTGDGGNAYQWLVNVITISDALDLVAWAPRIQRQGLDENLIPIANQTFSGWTAFGGASVSLVQGYNRRLYKVLSDSASDAKGSCGVEIFPRWRNGDAVADGDPVNVFSPKGLFRLQDNPRTWQIGNDLLTQGVTLKCKEAL